MQIKKLPLGNPPSGWRMLTCAEFTQHRSECLAVMTDWAICALKDGKCDGKGYGGNAQRQDNYSGIGEMLVTPESGGGGGGGGGHGGGSSSSRSLSEFQVINYLDDIPDGWRLLGVEEFEANRSACLRVLQQWSICLLYDGKADGHGYGGHAQHLTRKQRARDSTNELKMGELLIVRDGGGSELTSYASDVLSRYESYMRNQDDTRLVESMLVYRQPYLPYILVSSCPGDSHGGVHSRVKQLTESHGWRFAPVQFSDRNQAADWKRLWKLQVEDFACTTVAEGRTTVLELKIDGGGAGCAMERSRNMTQWWIDWTKRLGADICEDLGRRSGGTGPVCPPGCVQVQIGQAVVGEDDYARFVNEPGHPLEPVSTNGTEFELHTLVLHPGQRFWALVTDKFSRSGGGWRREGGSTFQSSGAF